MITRQYIERTDPRLGRHVAHDPESRNYEFTASAGLKIQSVVWPRHAPIFDQGQIGSCTGNAMVGALATGPLYDAYEQRWAPTGTNHGALELNEDGAVQVYSEATQIDRIKGVYPPVDTGSAGLYVAKVAKAHGWIDSYRHAFSIRAFLTALQHGPVIAGTLWYPSMFTPDEDGIIRPDESQDPAGGHEYLIRGYDPASSLVLADNSWGAKWGVNGSFRMHLNDFGSLLVKQGDVTVPMPLAVA